MNGWQSIATAPKDGTVVLVFVPLTGRAHACWWDVEFEYGWDEASETTTYRGAWTDGAVQSFGYEETKEYEPTHWMPLPDPPQVSR